MADKNIFKVFGGLDARESFGIEKEAGILYCDEAKNIDILGKTIRRGRGQTSKLELASGGWVGLTEHEVSGAFSMAGIDDNGNYYRISESGGTIAFLDTAWDVSTASYDSKSKDVSSQEDRIDALFFNPDGTKMYIIGSANLTVYQYTLSTAWDVSTASYASKSKDISSQIAASTGVFFKPDGTAMYVGGDVNDAIFQYTLSTAWDVSTASYASKSKDISSEDTIPRGLFFKPDGTTMYIAGNDNDTVYQYTLSTAWDISTASYDSKSKDISSEDTTLSAVFFKPDGTTMYIVGNDNDTVFQYTVSEDENPAKGSIVGTTPYFFQFKSNLICITGADDPFIDDGTTISQTGFYTAKEVYGTCGAAFHGRIFIANGTSIFWTAAGSMTDWTTAQDAGNKVDFNGTIIDMKVFGCYLLIFTTSDVYYLSGHDTSDFKFDMWSGHGIFSKFANCKLDQKIYTFFNSGLYPIEVTGDISQVQFKSPLSYKIANLLEEIDQDRLDDIIIVPYEKRKQIWCYIPVTGNTTLYKAYVVNFINQDTGAKAIWTTREANAITCACHFKGEIYTGTSTGKIYKEDDGATFDSTAIDSALWFPDMTFASSRIKNCEQILSWFNSTYDNKFTFNVVYDGQEDDADTEDIDFSSEKDANNRKFDEILNIRDEWKSIKLGLTTDAADEDFLLYAFTFIDIRTTNEI